MRDTPLTRQATYLEYMDRITDCVLVVYFENGGSVDNQTLVRLVHAMIEGDYIVERFQLATHLMDARRRLRMQALIERVEMPGNKKPGIWRLTHRGKDRAAFLKETRFPK